MTSHTCCFTGRAHQARSLTCAVDRCASGRHWQICIGGSASAGLSGPLPWLHTFVIRHGEIVAHVQQIHPLHPDCHGARRRHGRAGLRLPSPGPGRHRIRCQPDRAGLPAPDQDDHRAAGVRHPGRRHRPYGLGRQARPHLRQDHGLVRLRLLRVAAARPGHGQPAAARRQLPRHPAGEGPVDRPAGLGLLDREIPHPPDPDLDRRCDGAERDPADRGLRGVLRRRHGGDAGARQADAEADRGSRPHHAEGDGLRDAVRAARGVGRHHGDGLQERPRRAVEAGRLHGRLLPLADDPVGHPDRGRLHRARARAIATCCG